MRLEWAAPVTVGNDHLYFALIETPWLDDSNFAKALKAGRAS